MLMWLIIIVAIVILLVLFKFKELRHQIGLGVIAVILIFFIISFVQIYNSAGVDLKSFDGISKVANIYFSWLSNLFGNVGKIAGYAIHQDWAVDAADNFSNSSAVK